MNFQKVKSTKIISITLIILAMALVSFAQVKPKKNDNEPSTIVYDNFKDRTMKVAGMNNLYCGGRVQKASFDNKLKIVGADDEKDKHIYANGDFMYISAGAKDGVKVGDMYSVIRPKGKVYSKWTKKKNLGVYVQELGAIEVVKTMRDVSVAKVKTSCSVMLLGDLLTRVPNRESPIFKKRAPLNKFSNPSGKAMGRIFMARDNIEVLGREHIVYVDLGREDSVKIGDYLTVFRKLGIGNIFRKATQESSDNKEDGNESDRYRGGTFSNQTARKKGVDGNGAVQTSEDAKKNRPDELRKVVGELIILNVYERTATAMIVRNASEIHTGDQVEVQ